MPIKPINQYSTQKDFATDCETTYQELVVEIRTLQGIKDNIEQSPKFKALITKVTELFRAIQSLECYIDQDSDGRLLFNSGNQPFFCGIT